MLKTIKNFHATFFGKILPGASEKSAARNGQRDFWRKWRKSYPRFPSIPLDSGQVPTVVERLLEERSSNRVFSPHKLPLSKLSGILGVCRVFDTGRIPERRGYASAGATFPLEIYVVSFATTGLSPNTAFHLEIDGMELEEMWGNQFGAEFRSILPDYIENPAAAIVMTTVISRSEVRYGAKSYPFSFVEAGLLGQNIQLAATSLGVGSCMIGGFPNDLLTEALDLPEDEFPVMVIALGELGSSAQK